MTRASDPVLQAVTSNCVLRDATRLIARTYHGARGTWAYDAFDEINRTYFQNALPWPLLTWALTAHGRCLGHTQIGQAPVITLHPSVLGGTETANPWRVPSAWLGWRFAHDVLIHECIHVSVDHVLGGRTGPTSHNCPEWIREVNRLAPLLEVSVTAAMSKTARVRDEDGRSRVVRRSASSVPFAAITTFPYGVRYEEGTAHAYYTTGNTQLRVSAGDTNIAATPSRGNRPGAVFSARQNERDTAQVNSRRDETSGRLLRNRVLAGRRADLPISALPESWAGVIPYVSRPSG